MHMKHRHIIQPTLAHRYDLRRRKQQKERSLTAFVAGITSTKESSLHTADIKAI